MTSRGAELSPGRQSCEANRSDRPSLGDTDTSSSLPLDGDFVLTELVLQEGKSGIVSPDKIPLLSTTESCPGTILSCPGAILSCLGAILFFQVTLSSCLLLEPGHNLVLLKYCFVLLRCYFVLLRCTLLFYPSKVQPCPSKVHPLVMPRLHLVLPGHHLILPHLISFPEVGLEKSGVGTIFPCLVTIFPCPVDILSF